MPFATLADIAAQVKLILASEPISVIYCAAFHAFAREIRGLQRVYPEGPELTRRVSEVLVKWKNWKLDERVMHRILREIFEISVTENANARVQDRAPESVDSEGVKHD